MAIRTFKRYEKKYLIPENKLKTFLGAIQLYMNPDTYCIDGKKYKVYNIYCDDEQNSIIRHSLSKPYYKEKLRIRSYKPFENPDDNVYLEIKKKIGDIVSKRRATMSFKDAIEFVKSKQKPHLEKYIDNQVTDEIMFFLTQHPVRPAVSICYDRQAFFGKDNSEFRLTVDSGIIAQRYNPLYVENDNYIRLLDDGFYLMEIKILESIPMWLTQLMSELDIKKVHFSKYGTFYKKEKFCKSTETYTTYITMAQQSIVR